MDCFTGIVSFLFFIFTAIVWLVGLGMVGVASYWMVDYNYVTEAADTDTLSYVSIAVIVLGVVLFFMGLLGCCGTCKKSKCMLYLFAVFLAVIVVAQLALCIYSFVERNDAEDDIKKGLHKTAEQYLTDKNMMKAWDEIQSNIKCCGSWENADDWSGVLFTKTVPKSCFVNDACEKTAFDCKAADVTDENKDDAQCVANIALNIYSEGCGKKVVDTVKDNLVLVGAVLLVFIFLQILGIFSAVLIAKSKKNDSPQYA